MVIQGITLESPYYIIKYKVNINKEGETAENYSFLYYSTLK